MLSFMASLSHVITSNMRTLFGKNCLLSHVTPIKTLILICVGLLFATCNVIRTDVLFVEATNFTDEVSLQQRFLFRFNQEMADDVIIGEWINDKELMEFDPPIMGSYQFVSKFELLFKPDNAMPACTDYKVRVGDDLLSFKADKRFRRGRHQKIGFHTPFLKAAPLHGVWHMGDVQHERDLHVLLSFNYSLKAEELLANCALQMGDKNMEYKVLTLGDKDFALLVKGAHAFSFPTQVKVTLKKGLSSEACPLNTDVVLDYELGSHEVLQVSEVTTEYRSQKSRIHIHMNQLPMMDDLASSISIQPSVDIQLLPSPKGFIIEGMFIAGVSYDLSLDIGLKSVLGLRLQESYNSSIMFGEKPSKVQFLHKKTGILPASGERQLEIRIDGMEMVKVRISKIFENNLIPFYNRYNYTMNEDDEYSWNRFSPNESNPFGSVIYERDVRVSELKKFNDYYLLDMGVIKEDHHVGLYYVEVFNPSDMSDYSSRYLLLSEMGLIARQSGKEVMVMVNSLSDARPLSDVTVKLISHNNQSIKQGVTNSQGVVVFKDMDKVPLDFKLTLLSAEKNGDYSFMYLDHNRVSTSRFEVGGMSALSDNDWWVFIHADRDLYRPQETIYFNTIIRDEFWKPVEETHVVVGLFTTGGTELFKKRVMTNAQGAVADSFLLPSMAKTGFYQLIAKDLKGNVLAYKALSVESFVPEKIRLIQVLKKAHITHKDTQVYSGQVKTLFGTLAADRAYTTEVRYHYIPMTAKGFESFNFMPSTKRNYLSSKYLNGKTNKEGRFSDSITLNSQTIQSTGLIQCNLMTSVFDETGRPIVRTMDYKIHTQDIYPGIAQNATYVATNKPNTIQLVSVDKSGKPVKAKIRLDVVKVDWRNIMERRYGEYRYRSEKSEKVLSTQEISLTADINNYTFTPRSSGQYEVRVYLKGALFGVVSTFYSYDFASGSMANLDLNPDGEITIEADKEQYKPGDKAKFIFKTPFKGKMLITTERNELLHYDIIDVKEDATVYELPIKEKHLPNVFITATLIRPFKNDNNPLTVAHGFCNVKIDAEQYRLPVEIKASSLSRSRTKQKITVKTKPGAQVVISAVDEGILQIKNYKTPNPFLYFYGSRRLTVAQYDLYHRMFPRNYFSKRLLTGGGGDDYYLEADEDAEENAKSFDANSTEKRNNSMDNQRFKPLSFWSQHLTANASGEATYEFYIPEYYGEIRIMAVAYHKESFGASEKKMKIYDPLMCAPSLPRFCTPGDQIDMGVTIFNTTDKPIKVTATIGIQGFTSSESNQKSMVVPAKGEVYVVHPIKADEQLGKAEVKVTLTGGGHQYESVTNMDIRSPSGLLKYAAGGIIRDNKPLTIQQPYRLIQNTAHMQLILDNSPFTAIAAHLPDLLGYPHGCSEQLVSKAFPQLYLEDISKKLGQSPLQLISGSEPNDLNPSYNVKEAINALRFYNKYDGAISTWPGHWHQNEWNSLYVFHFLLSAKAKGYDVPSDLYDPLLKYVKQVTQYYGIEYIRKPTVGRKPKKVLVDDDFYDYYDYDEYANSQYVERYKASKIYGLYLLSLAGQPDIPSMNSCFSSLNKLDYYTTQWLALAYGAMGDKKKFNTLMGRATTAPLDFMQYGHYYRSDLRDKALILNALCDIDLQHPILSEYTVFVAGELGRLQKPNTQELAFCALALGKLAALTPSDRDFTLKATSDGRILGEFKGDKGVIKVQKWDGKPIQIQKTGSGLGFYSFTTRGISAGGGVPNIDQGLSARKTFYHTNGQVADLKKIKQGDLLLVKLTVNAGKNLNETLKDVVLTDMLPACFEIENPRLTDATRTYPWMENTSWPEHFDPRDDRVNFYFNLYENKPFTIYYLVRAVSKGEYSMGPVSADAMYNQAFYSYFGSGKVKVE